MTFETFWHRAKGYTFKGGRWSCSCGRIWEILYSRNFPERYSFKPKCTCRKEPSKMNPVKLNPGNIYSGNRKLAVFTNPTELAFRKGNLRHHYPITFNGVVYADAEAAYQKTVYGRKDDFDFCKATCVKVLEAKLKQYPIIFDSIKLSGGLKWIARCEHIVHARTSNFKRWEGVGRNSVFINCLYKAFEKGV